MSNKILALMVYEFVGFFKIKDSKVIGPKMKILIKPLVLYYMHIKLFKLNIYRLVVLLFLWSHYLSSFRLTYYQINDTHLYIFP